MYICSKCGAYAEKTVRFCDQCGSPMIEICDPVEVTEDPTPVWEIPVNPEPVKETPNTTKPVWETPPTPEPIKDTPTTPPPASMGKKLVGTILSGVGLGFGALGLLLTGAMLGSGEAPSVGAIPGICFSVFGLPLSLVGLIMSAKCVTQGKNTGKILGLIGTILSAALLLAGIASLAGGA